MFIPQYFRIKHAHKRATQMLSWFDQKAVNRGHIQEVQKRLRSHQIVSVKDKVIVTEAGFVTMAILPEFAQQQSGMLAVPGVDDKGQQGYLVIRPDSPPFHSLANHPEEAIAEAVDSLAKSEKLLAVYGSKTKMLRAVTNAPLLLFSTVEDFEASGLCLWGSESFLQRIGLLTFARCFGLPRLLLRFSGAYGIRLTAATLMRQSCRTPSTPYAVSYQESPR